jgi:hypothetical protein
LLFAGVRLNQKIDVARIEAVFRTVVEQRSAYYVSTPITTGRRFVKWRSATALAEVDPRYVDEHRRRVIQVNFEEVRPFVHSLRRRLSVPVIDPTALDDIPGWTQEDYRSLWARVIERYVDTVVFVYGWEYSSGCSYEFLVAKQAGVKTVDSAMNELTIRDGLILLAAAMDDYRQANLSVEYLETIQRQLSALLDGRK